MPCLRLWVTVLMSVWFRVDVCDVVGSWCVVVVVSDLRLVRICVEAVVAWLCYWFLVVFQFLVPFLAVFAGIYRERLWPSLLQKTCVLD